MATNAERQQAYRARKKAEKLQAPAPAVDGGTSAGAAVGEPALSVSIKTDDTPKPKPTLRERLGLGSGSKQALAPKRTPGKKIETPNLITTVLPTLLATLIAAWCKDLIPEDYQLCAPTRKEVGEIIGPLLDILGDEVEVAVGASKNTIRLINALIASMAYGVRAYVQYVDIKKAKEAGLPHEQPKAASQQFRSEPGPHAIEPTEPSLASGLRAYQAAHNGTDINLVGGNGAGPAVTSVGAASNGTGDPDDDRAVRDYEAGLVSQMFARDRAGRVKLGLLPG